MPQVISNRWLEPLMKLRNLIKSALEVKLQKNQKLKEQSKDKGKPKSKINHDKRTNQATTYDDSPSDIGCSNSDLSTLSELLILTRCRGNSKGMN